MKPRINIYLDDNVAAQLALLAKRPGLNKSRIVNDALDRFFNPERDEVLEKVLLRRLDRISTSQSKIERNESIATETLALFVRYFLTITPPLPQAEQAAAHALGKERFEVFVAQVGQRLAQDKNLLSEVLLRITDNRPDLFTSSVDGFIATKDTEAEDTLPPLRPVTVIEDDPDFEDVFDVDDEELFEGEDHV